MSLSRKKRRVHSLSSQKLSRKKKSHINKQKKNFFKIFFLLFKNLVFQFFHLLFTLIKKGPIVFSGILIIILAILVFKTENFLKKTHQRDILPTQIQMNVANPRVSQNLSIELKGILNKTNRNHENRAYLLAKISEMLASFDIIDQYWIRLGLDNVLQITATLQVPTLIINAKDNEKYVISNRMKIIAKNPEPNEYPALLNIDAPELKINWEPKSNKTHRKLPAQQGSNSNFNFPWLGEQIYIITNAIKGIGKGYTLKKITWTSRGGFVLSMNAQNSFTVLLGNGAISTKISRLHNLLATMKNQNIFPTEIDLDYLDKAIVKII